MKRSKKNNKKSTALTAPSAVAYLSPGEPKEITRDRPLVSLHKDGFWSAEFKGSIGYGASPGAALAQLGWVV